jgi:hypothetical protein
MGKGIWLEADLFLKEHTEKRHHSQRVDTLVTYVGTWIYANM